MAMPEFRAMKRRPMLIDTARGGLVDEADLVREIAHIWVKCHKYCFL